MTVTLGKVQAGDPAVWFGGQMVTAAAMKANITDPINNIGAMLGDTGYQTLQLGASWAVYQGHTALWRVFAGFLDIIGIFQNTAGTAWGGGTTATTICNAGAIPSQFCGANSHNRTVVGLNTPRNLLGAAVGNDGSVTVYPNGTTQIAVDLGGLNRIPVGM